MSCSKTEWKKCEGCTQCQPLVTLPKVDTRAQAELEAMKGAFVQGMKDKGKPYNNNYIHPRMRSAYARGYSLEYRMGAQQWIKQGI